MSFLVSYQKLSNYLHFGAELTDEIRQILARGEKLTTFFDQKSFESIPLNISIYLSSCILIDLWADKDIPSLKITCDKFIKDYKEDKKFREKVDKTIEESKDFETFAEKIKKYYLK